MKIVKTIGSVGLILAGVLSGLYSSALQAAEYKIVIAQSVTGPVSFIGAPVKDGMLIAIDEINKSRALGPNNTLKVVVEDDAGDRAQALSLLTRHAADPSVLVYLGPTTGTIAPAAARAAQDLKIPLFTISNSVDAHAAGPWAFTQSQSFATIVPFIANYAVDKKGVKACSIVTVSDNEAYAAQARIFADIVKGRGVTVLSEEKVKQSDNDFSALAVKVASRSSQDCLVLFVPAAVGANVLSQFRQAGLNPKTHVFGNQGFATPDLIRLGGPAVEGVIFNADWAPAGSNDMGKAFIKNFTQIKGREPGNWEPVGYSAIQVVAAAIKAAGPNPTRESVRDAMLKTTKIPVIVGDGFFSFDDKRFPRAGVVILTVTNGKFVKLN